MSDHMTPEQRHRCMSSIHSRDTKPEVKLRRALHGHGFRFRVNVRRLPGTPDIVLAKYHSCIFVNGCFWHGHDGCPKYTVPRTNEAFWREKVRRNRERDLVVAQLLETMGWYVVTVWECELGKSVLDGTVASVEERLRANLEDWARRKAQRCLDKASTRAAARERRETRKALEAELQSMFHIPARIVRLSETEET